MFVSRWWLCWMLLMLLLLDARSLLCQSVRAIQTYHYIIFTRDSCIDIRWKYCTNNSGSYNSVMFEMIGSYAMKVAILLLLSFCQSYEMDSFILFSCLTGERFIQRTSSRVWRMYHEMKHIITHNIVEYLIPCFLYTFFLFIARLFGLSNILQLLFVPPLCVFNCLHIF